MTVHPSSCRRRPSRTANIVRSSVEKVALAPLPEQHHAALTLRYLEEFSVSEVADAPIALTVDTVRTVICADVEAGFVRLGICDLPSFTPDG